jgi:hypothetical protein
VVKFDDAAWGFPILGILVGMCVDEGEVVTAEIGVQHFRKENYSADHVAEVYANAGLGLMPDFITPETHRIEICSGYVNRKLTQVLRDRGFDVSVTVITGKLQDVLEKEAREYVKRLCGADIYYDPKQCADSSEIAFRYKQAVEYGKKNCPGLLKNGWKALSNN